MKKELLFLVHRIPYPPNKGDKIRSFNLLKYISKEYRVHLGTFIDDAKDWQYTPNVQKLCGETYFATLNHRISKIKSLAGIAQGLPLTLVYYRNKKLKQWVDRIIRTKNIDSIIVFSSAMAQYVEGCIKPSLRKVIDFVDVDSDKWKQYALSKPPPLSWIYRRESKTLLQYERKIAAQFSKSVFVSKREALLFKKLAPESNNCICYINNGVDTEYFSSNGSYPNPYDVSDQVLVFTGAMDYWANVDAVCWFAKKIFPSIRTKMKNVSFCIVGAKPTRQVRSLKNIPGIFVTGAVKDIRPYIAHASVSVAPLCIARGVQNKILESIAIGCPVVATSCAAQGLSDLATREIKIADEPSEFARAAIELLQKDLIKDQITTKRNYALKDYQWQENIKLFANLLNAG